MAKRFTVSALLTAEDRASGVVGRVRQSFGSLGALLRTGLVAAAAGATAAVGALAVALREGVGAANVQEEAVQRLTTALVGRLGPAGRQVAEELQAYASALQRTTTAGDEQILSLQALLVEMGVAPGQIAEATRATLDLSAALGKSLEESARNVARTTSGLAGELGEAIPELRELSSEALRAGEGITLLADRFEGRAAAAAQTFRGQVTQLRNAWGDLLEVLGTAITENESLRASIDRLTDALQSQGAVDAVEALAGTISRLTSRTIEAAGATADFLRGVREIGRGASESTGGVVDLSNVTNALVENLVRLPPEIQRVVSAVRELGRQARLTREAEVGLEEQQRRMAAAFRETVLGLLDVSRQTRATRVELEGLRDAQGDVIDASDAYLAKLEELGVSLESNVNAKIRENNTFLEQNRELLRRNEITLRDFEAVQAAVARENERLTSSLRSQREEVEPLGQGFEDAAVGVRTYRGELESASRTLDTFRETQRRATDEVVRARSVSGSSSFGGTLTGGGSQLFPDSALANTAIRGGRLVRVLPDGRRVFA